MGLLSITTGEGLDACVEKHASTTAIIEGRSGKAMTWRSLSCAVDDIAKGLLAKGLRKGDRLGIWAPNSLEWVICFLAAAKIGVIVVGINIHFKEKELENVLRGLNLRALCFNDGFRDNNFNRMLAALPADVVPEIVIGYGEQHAETVQGWSGLVALGQGVGEEQYSAAQVAVSCHDAVAIQLTSGSMAQPKRVLLSHYNLLNNAFFGASRLGVTPTDSLCLPIPFFHCFGLVYGLYFAVMSGCSLVILDNYSTDEILNAVQRYRCSVLHGVPTIFSRLIQHPRLSDYDISTLEKGVVAGAYCSPKLVCDIATRLAMPGIAVSWGQTETSPCCTQTLPEESLAVKSVSIGRPLPFVEMKVIDGKTKQQCAPGVKGELCTRGYHLMMGYDGDPELTHQVIDEQGWFHSGDIGFIDQEGNFHYAWRKKELIVRGGENISPREIEEAILECPGIDAVYVFGVSSESMGEEVVAAVCPQHERPVSEQLLLNFLRERIARYKVPAHLYFFSTFPLTACGKTDKQSIRRSINTLMTLPPAE
ncbi:AMP-binding protein [Pseudocitrobacter cyperus]|uniref:AMP-binding protein n=1 Tax=Pseudocitrobacter cyperus TaxID=3112843 RepID=A0ABV0HKY4_9ENTR